MAEKVSKEFQRVIKAYLDEKAGNDAAFAEKYQNGKKSIGECCDFILNTVRESGRQGFTDPEIYGIAIHYYDEDELDPKYLKPISGKVVVNHEIELSEAEKAEQYEKAKRDYYEEQLRKQRELVSKPKRKTEEVPSMQLSLF